MRIYTSSGLVCVVTANVSGKNGVRQSKPDLLHKENPVEINHSGGQSATLHLQADLDNVVAWAKSAGRRWAVSRGNAGAKYAQFHNSLAPMAAWNWDHIQSTDWSDPIAKDAKQSEFLIHESLPWTCIQQLGVISDTMQTRVNVKLTGSSHKPHVSVQPDWYY